MGCVTCGATWVKIEDGKKICPNGHIEYIVEDAQKFEQWLYQMLSDAKNQLGMTDRTIADILLREGTAYYHKTIAKK